MKKIYFYLLLNLLLCFLYAKEKIVIPEWVNNEDNIYPNTLYIKGTGSGSSQKVAEEIALSKICQTFNTKVKSYNTAIKQYKKTKENDKIKTVETDEFEQNISVSSDIEFFCVEYAETYYNQKEKKYYSLAFIDRKKAISIYDTKISSYIYQIEKIIENTNNEVNSLYQLGFYNQAFLLGEMAKDLIFNAQIIDSSKTSSYKKYLQKISDLEILTINMRQSISFNVSCNNQKGISLISGIASILEQSGFIFVEKNPLYQIKINLSFEEESYEAGEFVRPSMVIQIVDKYGNEIDSYSKNYPRYTHSSLELAYTRAVFKIQEDLEENFLSSYR